MVKFKNYIIDLNLLTRDYQQYPLNVKYGKRNTYETPVKEDIEYLYIQLNFSLKDIENYFNVSECVVLKWLKNYNIKKEKSLHIKNILNIKQNKCLTKEILDFTKGFENLDPLARKYMFDYKIKKIPLCPICHKQVKWNKSVGEFYKTCGDIECLSKYKKTIGYDKTKKTLLEKYGDERYNNIKQNHITNKNNHNGVLFNNTPKRIQTCLKKYKVKNYTQTDEYKNLYNDKDFVKDKHVKEYKTKKQNNSFNISKPEDEIYNILITKFSSTLRQYKTNLYPFACDFYIPELDLYIEINFHWTHGSRIYNVDDIDCIKQLNEWKEKSINSKFYQNAIYVWTKSDVNKRQVAKNNNLNWIEFFNMSDFNKWFEEL